MKSLIEEKNFAFRDLEPGGSPVEAFLKVWPRLEPHYGTMAEQLKTALEGALPVRCTVSARVKSLTSITKSIKRRQTHRGKQYREVDEIFDDLHDLAGFRIVVDYPSGIQIANAFIKQSFQVKSTNIFKADREVSDAWKPTFGSFQSENHHLVLHPDAKYPLSPFCGILFEIQISSLAESLYNRLAHPLLYKKASGQLSIQEQKMIDVTHGLSLCYWICLSCMEERLEGKESQEIPIPIQKVAQLDVNQNADMESIVKATPCLMPESGERIPIEKCLDSVRDLSKEAMTADQLQNRLTVLLGGSTQISTTNTNYGSGHIVQNYGSSSNTHSNNTYNSAGGNITFAKEDTEDEIRNAFWVTDPQSHKEDIQERKGGLVEGSYRWILQDEQFTKWYQSESSLLWLNGDPGKGKTMSVCGIIDHISALSDSNTILSYFFCDASDSNFNNAASVLRGIVYSIVFQNSTALSYIRKRFKEFSKPLSDPRVAWTVLQKIFIGIFSAMEYQKTYLIIDGLDECREDRAELLEFIVKKCSSLPVKWLVSSRKWPVIKEILKTHPELLEANLEDNETDVCAAVDIYISHQMQSLSSIKQYDQKRKEAVEHHLRSKSNSTFLWASLVCQMLKKIPAWQTTKRLDSFPAGLDALYGRMLEQIQPSPGEERDLGFDSLYAQIISLTLGTFRPLSLDELYYLVGDDGISVKDLEDIVALCGSFLTIQRRVVHFIHESAKDYLLNEANGFKFDPEKQHAVLFSKSLSNLTQSLRRDILYFETCNPRTVQESLGFISYQCLHWISHLIESGPLTITQALMDGSFVDSFLRQKFLFWLEALGHLKSIGLGISEMLKLEHMLDNQKSELKDLVQDELRFIRYHGFGIEQFPLQVYPLLNFSPSKSMTRTVYKSEAPAWFTLKLSLDDYWSPCISTLEGHDDFVRSVAFSHDGRLLASGSQDTTVRIWDVSTGACLRTLLGHDDMVYSLAFSPKNYTVATGSNDNTIKIWHADNGSLIRTFHCHNAPIRALTFSKNGKLIASSAEDGTVKLLDIASGECKRRLLINDGSFGAWSIAFTHDDQILSCGTVCSVLIWDLKDQSEPYRIDMGNADFPPKLVVSAQTNELFLIRDHDVEVWDPLTKIRMRTIRHPACFPDDGPTCEDSILLSRHGNLLGVMVDGDVKIVSPSTSEWIAQIPQRSLATSISPTYDILALASYHQYTVTLWDLPSITQLNVWLPESHSRPMVLNDNSSTLLDLKSETEVMFTKSCSGYSNVFAKPWPGRYQPIVSFDGQSLIVRFEKAAYYITNGSKEEVGVRVPPPKPDHGVPVVSHDGNWLAVPYLTCVDISGLHAPHAHVRITPNEDQWEVGCSFSNDSETLAIYNGKSIDFYDTNTWLRNLTLYNVEQEGLSNRTVLFSSDDKFLVTTSHQLDREETELNIWNLETKACTRIVYKEGCFKPLKLDVSTVLQLETDFGTFQIVDKRIQLLVPPKYAISEDLQWIMEGSERLIWLPPDYRPDPLSPFAAFRFCRACFKHKVAISTISRRLIILALP